MPFCPHGVHWENESLREGRRGEGLVRGTGSRPLIREALLTAGLLLLSREGEDEGATLEPGWWCRRVEGEVLFRDDAVELCVGSEEVFELDDEGFAPEEEEEEFILTHIIIFVS